MQLLLQMLVSEMTTAERSTQMTIEGETTSIFASEFFSLDEATPEIPSIEAGALAVMPELEGSLEETAGKTDFAANMPKTTVFLTEVEDVPLLPTPNVANVMQPEAKDKGVKEGALSIVDPKPASVSALPARDRDAGAGLPADINRPRDGRLPPISVPVGPKVEAKGPMALEKDISNDMTSRDVRADPPTDRAAPMLRDPIPAIQDPRQKPVPIDGKVQLISPAQKNVPRDVEKSASPSVDVPDQPVQKTPIVGPPVVVPAKGDAAETRFEIRSHRTKRPLPEPTGAVPKPTHQGPPMAAPQPSFSALSTMPERPVLQDGSVSREPLFPVVTDPSGAGVIEGVEEKRPLQPVPRPDQVARPVVQQVTQSIMRSNFEGSVEVRLWPEELGKVRLAMSPSDVGLTVMVTAERPETLDLMRRHIDLLAADLRENGFDGLEFQFGDAHEQQNGAETASVKADDDAGLSANELTLTTTENASPGLVDGRLDIRV